MLGTSESSRLLEMPGSNEQILLMKGSVMTDLSVVIHKGRPVEHVHGVLKAEQGLFCQLSPLGTTSVPAL